MDIIHTLLDWLQTFSSSPWFYLVIFVIALLDSVFPAVPSETTVILGGIAAGQGELNIVLVILLGLMGAYIGDSLAYGLGSRFGTKMLGRFLRGDNHEERLEAMANQITKRGGVLLITARFIPGGRTLVTFTCGATKVPFWLWFTRWDLLATTLWASYAGLLGFFFGERFEDNHTAAFLWAFSTAVSVAILLEVVRYLRERSQKKSGQEAEPVGSRGA